MGKTNRESRWRKDDKIEPWIVYLVMAKGDYEGANPHAWAVSSSESRAWEEYERVKKEGGIEEVRMIKVTD